MTCNENTIYNSSSNTIYINFLFTNRQKPDEMEMESSIRKTIYENDITRIKEKNDLRGMTNAAYQSLDYLIEKIKKDAQAEMWTKEKFRSKVDLYKSLSKGGLIHIYFTRLSIDSANSENFTVILKDSNDVEIMRKELEYSTPDLPLSGDDYWRNSEIISLPESLNGKYYIYIVDELTPQDNKIFQFEINVTE